MKKVCVFVGSRANYSSIKSAMTAINAHPDLELQVVTYASAVLDRYGDVAGTIQDDGFEIDAHLFSLIEGESPETMAKSTGLALIELPGILTRLKPDIIVTVGDRFETMAVTIAASYMNIGVAHTMGGEVTGTIDESIRHATTKFAHLHFVASEDAKQRVLKLGEEPSSVRLVGCPRLDLVLNTLSTITADAPDIFQRGGGKKISLGDDFLMVSQHPVTTEYEQGEEQMLATLYAVKNTNIPALVLWPNSDAGSDGVSRAIRKFRETEDNLQMFFVKNLRPETYVWLMDNTKCLVGNSSSGIREGGFIGTPVVNVGTRQNSRERCINTIDTGYKRTEIETAIHAQLQHGKYPRDITYGDGGAGKKIADDLCTFSGKIQKTISY